MDGENNGKAYGQMDDLEVFPYVWLTPISSWWSFFVTTPFFIGSAGVGEVYVMILLMEEIRQTTWDVEKKHKKWDELPINWCRISSINSRMCKITCANQNTPSK